MNETNLSLTNEQMKFICHRVRDAIRSLEEGDYKEYRGRTGLKRLADGVKSRGRKLLAEQTRTSGRSASNDPIPR